MFIYIIQTGTGNIHTHGSDELSSCGNDLQAFFLMPPPGCPAGAELLAGRGCGLHSLGLSSVIRGALGNEPNLLLGCTHEVP